MMNSLKTNLATHKFISHNFTEEHHQVGLKMTHLGSFQNSDAEEKGCLGLLDRKIHRILSPLCRFMKT